MKIYIVLGNNRLTGQNILGVFSTLDAAISAFHEAVNVYSKPYIDILEWEVDSPWVLNGVDIDKPPYAQYLKETLFPESPEDEEFESTPV